MPVENPKLRRLTQRKPVDAEAIDRFLERETFPLQSGRVTTFVYRGEAESVRLRHWIYGLPTSQAFERLDDTDLWHLSVALPARSRVEYKLEVERGGDRELIRDPLNPLEAHDPFGSNSVCHGLGYSVPEWTRPDPEARPGTVEKLEVPTRAFGGRREVGVYLPPRYRRRRLHPLLVAHDGGDYLNYSSLQTVLDNLIYRHEIEGPVVVLTRAEDRLREYADDPRHARFLCRDLLPLLEKRYSLDPRPAARVLMGASFGAVASLSAAWRNPGIFGGLLLQSGSFAFTDIGESRRGPAFAPVVKFMNRFRRKPGRPVEKIFISCGIYESLIYENRSLVPLLQETGMKIRYREARDGHNWENWRDQLRQGLSFLLPGPLWMVYE
ncbi:MAG: alpha/beta hydrolase-fold protein [Thermoanaerobaculia bacterium]|nr:alpha/beta hydrolase-fold protein [Thermoanaerobaculia bacterium]